MNHPIKRLIQSLQAKGTIWSSLQIYNLYRFILICMILVTYLSVIHPKLFIITAYSYLTFAFLAFYLTWNQNLLGRTFAYLNPILDLFFISTLMQSSGGISHGMGVLFIIVIVAQALLNPGYWGYATTFLGCTILIGLQLHDWILYPFSRISLFPTLALILTCLSCTLVAGRLVKRVARQSLALATAEQLNILTVSLMQQGVVIVDQVNQIKLINQKAKQLLNLAFDPANLISLPQDFQAAVNHSFSPNENYRIEIQPWETGKIIFLYDLIEEKKRAQTLKLASLGHLAANVAHEIRNPLSAVTQSAELLKEANSDNQHDRLFHILLENSKRINTVIQNVLSLSTRALPHAEKVALIPWLNDLMNDLSFMHDKKLTIEKTYPLNTPHIHCDLSQLRQVLLNLCENGIRHGLEKNPFAHLKILVTRSKNSLKNLIHIDIIDNGPGLSEEAIKHLFEPFYTTEKNGSGLGLFIAKELLEMNDGQLIFLKNNAAGCQFRISLYES